MEAGNPTEVRPGLRERKKQKTRETIIKVALELFAERGYEQTTIAEIADAADVSPRTIFAYFPSKQDILFYDKPDYKGRLARALRERPTGVTALDTALDLLRVFLAESLNPGPNEVLRRRIVASEEALRRGERAREAPVEQLMVEAIAEDLGARPDDVRPQIAAAALLAAYGAIRDPDPAAPPEAFSPEHALAALDDLIAFMRGGFDALRRD